MYQIYHLNSPSHHSPLIPPPPIPRILSTDIIFQLHICVHSICIIFTLLHPLPPSSSHWYQPTRQDMFCSPVLQFCKKEKWHFCLFKIATQGISIGPWLVHFFKGQDRLFWSFWIPILSCSFPFKHIPAIGPHQSPKTWNHTILDFKLPKLWVK
jgi:hypothetical protein